jgi:hypothetical protein
MPVQSLLDLTIDDEPYILIGIHAVVELYRMAYFINRHLNCQFARTNHDQDINLQSSVANFPVFRYKDHVLNAPMFLLPNKVWSKPKAVQSSGLFALSSEDSVKTTLIKEHPQIDFVLKIESDEQYYPLKQVIDKIKSIPRVISCYQLDPYAIKQKDYLIFE